MWHRTEGVQRRTGQSCVPVSGGEADSGGSLAARIQAEGTGAEGNELEEAAGHRDV